MSYTNITPFNADLYHGRKEPFENERACYWHELIAPYRDQKIGLVGFACDQGVRRNQGRVGAKLAPDVIRTAFGKLPCSMSILNQFGTDRNGELKTLIGDMGNIECRDNDGFTPMALEQTQAAYAEHVSKILKKNGLAIGLGGGHAISYGSFLGLWKFLDETQRVNQRIGIINFDAHLDIRQSDTPTSGTPFRQIAEYLYTQNRPFHYLCVGVSELGNTAALFDRADELGIEMIFDDDCYRKPFADIATQINTFIDQVDVIYLTIDMDCFAAGIVPGVSATAAKGLTLDFVEQAIELILATGKVKVADFAEINPNYDIDNLSTKVAARLLAKIANPLILSRVK